MGNKNATYIQQREFGTVCSQSIPIKEGKFGYDTLTSLSEKLLSSVIESTSENKNQNSVITKRCQVLQKKENVSDDLYNSYVQRSSPRSNPLRAMTEIFCHSSQGDAPRKAPLLKMV